MINCSLDVKALVMTEADLVLGSVTENRSKHKCLVVLLHSCLALGMLWESSIESGVTQDWQLLKALQH